MSRVGSVSLRALQGILAVANLGLSAYGASSALLESRGMAELLTEPRSRKLVPDVNVSVTRRLRQLPPRRVRHVHLVDSVPGAGAALRQPTRASLCSIGGTGAQHRSLLCRLHRPRRLRRQPDLL